MGRIKNTRFRIPAGEQRKFERFVKRHVRKSREEVVKDVQAAGLVAETVAGEAAPVDKGRLRQSIRKESRDEGMAADIGTNVEYAPFQEYGTRFIKGKHFMLKGGRAGSEYLIKKLRG